MPYKFEYDNDSKITLAGTENDKRKKLTDEQKASILKEYNTGLISQRELARKYGIDRKIIYFMLHPEKYQEQLEKYKEEQHHKKYYNKEKQREYLKRYRLRKKNIYDTIEEK